MNKTRFLLLAGAAAIFGASSFAQTTVTIVATDAAAAETLAGQPANPGSMRITRTGSTASALTVWVKVSGIAVQGEDYTFGSTIGASVVIPAGSSTLDIPVNVIDDWLTEGTEDVRIKLDTKTATGANVPYTIVGTDRAIVNIADNEDPLAPLRAIVTVATETPGGTDPAVFRITRTNNLAPALNILYSLGGTATPGVDYTTPPATITIPAGVGFVDVPIVPIDDPLIEDPESVTLTILPTNVVAVPLPAEAYALGSATTATATIYSDDVPPPPVVTITAPGSNAAVASGAPVTVNFTASSVDGYITTYTVIASGGTSAYGTTNLPPSTPAGTPFSGTATVTFTGGNAYHQLTVLATSSNGTMATSAPLNVYVFNAPPPPPPPPNLPVINIYALDAEGAEVSTGAPNPASFRVTHNFPASASVSFLFVMGGTAKEGADYTLASTSGTLAGGLFGRWFTFAPGTTEAEIVVNPVDDLLIESSETVAMSLYTPPFIGFNEGVVGTFDWQAAFGFYYGTNSSAIVSILDNDTAPPPFPLVTIAATDSVGTETVDGSDPAVFTVTRRTGPTDVPLTVNYALTIPPKQTIYVTVVRPVMAQNGADLPLLTGTVTIPAGATSADLVVVPTYDLLREVPELLEITLLPSVPVWPVPGGYVIDANIVAQASILDAVLPTGTPTVWVRVTDAFALRENFPGRTASFAVEPRCPLHRRRYGGEWRGLRGPARRRDHPGGQRGGDDPDQSIPRRSTDLVTWQPIGTTDPSGEGGDFVDVDAGDFPSRFYRFRAPAVVP